MQTPLRFVLILLASLLQGHGAEIVVPARESDLLTRIRQLTFDGRRSGEGYFSPDGKKIIFQSEREANNPFYQIYILDLETGDTSRVSPGVGKTTCAFFRPGLNEILFSSTHLDPLSNGKQKAETDFRASGAERRYSWDYDPEMEIFAARQDGSMLRRLTQAEGYDAEASYSPDGAKIVFCSLRHAYPTNRLSQAELKRLEIDPSWFGEIYLMNSDGTGVKRLTDNPGYDGGPFFSPDGTRIVWRRFDETGVIADLYSMRLDGSDVRRLTDFKSMSWAPYYHPSGKYLIFTSNKLGFSNFELHLVDVAGEREPIRITFTDGFDGLPVFSPDGRKLCWTSGRTSDQKSQLFLADWNHAAALAALENSPKRVTPPGEGFTYHPEIHTNDLRREIALLSSAEMEGRMTGSKGAELASTHLAERLRAAGVGPLLSDGTFFQPFEFTSGVRTVASSNQLVLLHTNGVRSDSWTVDRDYRPLSFSANTAVEGEIVFVGYGLVVPGKPGEAYDSYAGINVSNKVVLALRYVPEGVEAKRRAELNRYAGLRYKAMLARNHGASAILFITGPNSPNAGELAPSNFDTTLAGSGIAAASVSSNVVQELMQPSGRSLKTLQDQLDSENPHAESGFTLPSRVRIHTSIEHIRKTDRNVLGVIGPSNSSELVLLGAHYDHLGHGETGSSLGSETDRPIHPGADDNASGTAAVLEIAGALAAEYQSHPARFTQRIAFAFWSGEELGLIGSSWFAEHSPVPLTNVTAYLNFDMVGRLRENTLTLQGVGSSSAWRKLIEKHNVPAGFNLTLQQDPYLPTDTTALYPKGVPVLNFFTGSHDDYHRPSDTVERIDLDGLLRISQFAKGIVLDLAKTNSRPDYLAVAKSDSGGSRDNLRAYLGTVPDYATEVEGVKLSGVRGGSPAELGGLKPGDIIKEFAGQKIANIYDYTYALDAVKIGREVQIVVERQKEKLTLKVTPQARK